MEPPLMRQHITVVEDYKTLVPTVALPFKGRMTLDKLLNLIGPQHPQLKSGGR